MALVIGIKMDRGQVTQVCMGRICWQKEKSAALTIHTKAMKRDETRASADEFHVTV